MLLDKSLTDTVTLIILTICVIQIAHMENYLSKKYSQ